MPNPGPRIRDYIRALPSDIKMAALAVPMPTVALGYGVGELSKPPRPRLLEHMQRITVPQPGVAHVPRAPAPPRQMRKSGPVSDTQVDRAAGPLVNRPGPASQSEADRYGKEWHERNRKDAEEDLRRAEEKPRESEDPGLAEEKEKSQRMSAALDDYKEFLRKGK